MIYYLDRFLVLLIIITMNEPVVSQITFYYTDRQAIEIKEGIFEAFPLGVGEMTLHPVFESILEGERDTVVLKGHVLLQGDSLVMDMIAICKPIKWSVRRIICRSERYRFVRFAEETEEGEFLVKVRIGSEVILFRNYRMNRSLILIPIIATP